MGILSSRSLFLPEYDPKEAQKSPCDGIVARALFLYAFFRKRVLKTDYLEIMDICGFDLDAADEMAEEYGNGFSLTEEQDDNGVERVQQ